MGSNQEETLGNGEERRAITKNVEVIEKIETIKKIEKKETMETREREEPQEDGMSRDMEDMEALERRRIQKRREHMLEMRRRKRRQEVLRSWTLLIAGGLVMAGLAVWGLARLVAEPGGEEGKTPGRGEPAGKRRRAGRADGRHIRCGSGEGKRACASGKGECCGRKSLRGKSIGGARRTAL